MPLHQRQNANHSPSTEGQVPIHRATPERKRSSWEAHKAAHFQDRGLYGKGYCIIKRLMSFTRQMPRMAGRDSSRGSKWWKRHVRGIAPILQCQEWSRRCPPHGNNRSRRTRSPVCTRAWLMTGQRPALHIQLRALWAKNALVSMEILKDSAETSWLSVSQKGCHSLSIPTNGAPQINVEETAHYSSLFAIHEAH